GRFTTSTISSKRLRETTGTNRPSWKALRMRAGTPFGLIKAETQTLVSIKTRGRSSSTWRLPVRCPLPASFFPRGSYLRLRLVGVQAIGDRGADVLERVPKPGLPLVVGN